MTAVDIRERLLDVTADLLAAAPSADVSTRAVAAAAGVSESVVRQHFADDAGLLAATVDNVYRRHLTAHEATVGSADPMADLRAGWDHQVAFAVAHPAIYRLLFAGPATATPKAVEESFQSLSALLTRCAEVGRLRVSVPVAARMVLAANVGVALSQIARPAQYPDEAVSDRLRDAVHAAVITPEAIRSSVSVEEDQWDTEWEAEEPAPESVDPVEVVIASPPTGMLAFQVQRNYPSALSSAETDALQATLDRAAENGSYTD
jgi:AcrR family transcriptional regulator